MEPLNIFLTTWNTGLQGSKAQSQDLTSWLLPVLQNTANDPELPHGVIPDLYVIGVQELLPVHLALAGLSTTVLSILTDRIQSLLSSHAKSLSSEKARENYTLVSRVSHVGVALWVFARERTLGGRLGKPLKTSLGLWYGGMGNKSAVGIRLPIRRGERGGWEVLTFVNTHLEAHDHNIPRRNQQYQNILSSLLFQPSDPLAQPYQIFDTSHLFIMGDLNYRLSKRPSAEYLVENGKADDLVLSKGRNEMLDTDTLQRELRAGRVFGGLREGDITRFAPTYKRVVGQVEGYSKKRIPGWTDRILFASYSDPPSLLANQESENQAGTSRIVHFSSTPELTISDHKPVHAIVQIPAPSSTSAGSAPHLAPSLSPAQPPHQPRPQPISKEYLWAWTLLGTSLDRLIGWPWCLLVLLGGGNEKTGLGVTAFVTMIWGVWWSGVWSA
ncbi:uncharacterized protein I303_104324 [Kwoniella dejecticola CBS 10117]|uniref:Inositol polyphosphate-related phosphatase domain-containing protein n=1 Tax=Kwoniella dejecticola CBS 10117 TaxID=1296121 RepID=A0A1A6A5N5_9TREE|nr:uncharacterized protein I303_04702 [Kwoniella dejecticola CBS 10117]OBR85367.1 hypothetical protein I303_04702 [Kwoniella dejecticola CBS 10117]